MGDFFLTYDESGKAYLRRLFYFNVLFYPVMGLVAVVYMIDVLVVIFAASLLACGSLIYAAYFIIRNPPMEYGEDLSALASLEMDEEDGGNSSTSQSGSF